MTFAREKTKGDSVKMDENNLKFVSKRQLEIQKGHPFFADQIRNVDELVDAKPTDTILDIGCFTGKMEVHFSNKGNKIYGIDISKLVLSVARGFISKEGNSDNAKVFLRDRPLNMMFDGMKFDIILMSDVVEHMTSKVLKKTLNEIKPIMKENTRLCIYTPNKEHWTEWLRTLGIDKTVGHINVQSPEQLRKAVENNGFEIQKFYMKPSYHCAFIERLIPFSFAKKRICIVAKRKVI